MTQGRVVLTLGAAQTLAWAGSYYIPAVLAAPMARDLGLSTPELFLAFSAALLLTACLGPLVGRAIDLHGGRGVLAMSSALFAAGMGLLSMAQSLAGLFVAWAVLGLGMAMGLYDPAFTALARLYGRSARKAIIGVTLLAGFASTLGWPLTAWMAEVWGWRGACLGWAALHVFCGLPLNLLLPRGAAAPPAPAVPGAAAPAPVARHARAAWLLAFIFGVGGFTAASLSAHLPALMALAGASPAGAIAAAALMGPAQVAARLAELALQDRIHPLTAARLAQLGHPLGVVALLGFGMPAGLAVLHGAGNGLLTVARGTLPLVYFGPAGYGARQGWLVAPQRFLIALAPLVFGMAIEAWGTGALWLTTGLGMAGFVALMVLRAPPAVAHQPT